MYKILLADIEKIINWLIPGQIRQSVHRAFVQTMNYPLRMVYSNFSDFKDKVNYRLNHNSQVCSLQGALNDSFDLTLRRIYIQDHIDPNKVWLYTYHIMSILDASELTILHDYNGEQVILQPYNILSDQALAFEVIVPPSILVQYEQSIINLVNYYRLASKKFQVI